MKTMKTTDWPFNVAMCMFYYNFSLNEEMGKIKSSSNQKKTEYCSDF